MTRAQPRTTVLCTTCGGEYTRRFQAGPDARPQRCPSCNKAVRAQRERERQERIRQSAPPGFYSSTPDPCPQCGVAQAEHWKCRQCGARGHAIPRSKVHPELCLWCEQDLAGLVTQQARAR